MPGKEEGCAVLGGRRPEKIVKSKVNWKKRDQVNRLKIGMIVLLVAICISVAAGAVLAWIEIADPFAEEPPASSAPVSSAPEEEEEELPVYDNSFNLVLANAETPLPDSFQPVLAEFQGVQVEERVLPALEKMVEDAQADGVQLSVVSCYVSPEEQDTEFETRVNALMEQGYTRVRAEDSVQKSFGRGGCNESQTGMTVEFSSGEEEFSSSAAARWLSKNSILYGFVLRFPQGSEDETGREYDPARYRYVGTENAEKMRQLSMCLEEYAQYLAAQQG